MFNVLHWFGSRLCSFFQSLSDSVCHLRDLDVTSSASTSDMNISIVGHGLVARRSRSYFAIHWR